MSFLIATVFSQALFMSEYYEVQIGGAFPSFTFTTLSGGNTLQQTTLTLLNVVELNLPDTTGPSNSTMILSSAVPPELVNWTLTTDTQNNKFGDFAKVNFSCYNTNRPQPEWNELTLALDWEGVEYNTNFTLQLIVQNYTWVQNTDTSTLAFYFGLSSAQLPQQLPTANATTVRLGSAFMNVSVNADIDDTVDPQWQLAPTWLWMNVDVIVVQIGHFNGNMVQKITIGNIYNLPIVINESPDFGLDLVILIVGIVVIGVIGIGLAVGVGVYLKMKSGRSSAYEPL